MKLIFFTVSCLLSWKGTYTQYTNSKTKTWPWGQKHGRGGSSISEVRPPAAEVSKEHAWGCTKGG